MTKFERRVVTQNYQGETFLTSENKGLIVDFYVKWRIKDVGHYYRTTGGVEDVAGSRLGEIVKDGIKSVVARRTLQEIVVAERTAGGSTGGGAVAIVRIGPRLLRSLSGWRWQPQPGVSGIPSPLWLRQPHPMDRPQHLGRSISIRPLSRRCPGR